MPPAWARVVARVPPLLLLPLCCSCCCCSCWPLGGTPLMSQCPTHPTLTFFYEPQVELAQRDAQIVELSSLAERSFRLHLASRELSPSQQQAARAETERT